MAKFYAVKTRSAAKRYAHRELESTQAAQAVGLDGGRLRAVRPLGLWRGVLFLEYVDGLTLEDVIAVRRSRPGTLIPCLERTAQLLATLHANGTQPTAQPNFQPAAADTREIIDTLAKHGVLQGDPILRDGSTELIDRWAVDLRMVDFTPAFTHGDATTSNFVFPWDGGIVAIRTFHVLLLDGSPTTWQHLPTGVPEASDKEGNPNMQ